MKNWAARILIATMVFLHLAVDAPLFAQQQSEAAPARIAQFTPRSATLDVKLDYEWWDTRLRNLVISMGPSNRSRPGMPQRTTGSSILWGHTSPYRLEGTRMAFSLLEPDVVESFTAYRRDLEQIAGRIDIAALPRDEQLAFWINLHNVSIAEQIAIHWPIQKPARIMIEGVPLHAARFITIGSVALSPADIRTRIVYPNWDDPRVIYGFWHGNIGGPSLQRAAFDAENVSRLLDRGAKEFVNSLRGAQRRSDRMEVSSLYQEVAPFYFADFENGLRTHIAQFAEEEVADILSKTSRTTPSISIPDIADLAGGMKEPNTTPVSINGVASGFKIPPSVARLLSERNTKLAEMRSDRRGTVIVRSSSETDEDTGTPEIQ